MDALKALFETSKSEGKGLMIYVEGQAVPGLVTEVTDDAVILRSQEFSKIVILLDEISGAALS